MNSTKILPEAVVIHQAKSGRAGLRLWLRRGRCHKICFHISRAKV